MYYTSGLDRRTTRAGHPDGHRGRVPPLPGGSSSGVENEVRGRAVFYRLAVQLAAELGVQLAVQPIAV